MVCDKMQSDDEREMCTRTVYCTNIDKKVANLFFLFLHNNMFALFPLHYCFKVSR